MDETMTTTAAQALLDLALAEWGPGALLCWKANGALMGPSQDFCRLLGLDGCDAVDTIPPAQSDADHGGIDALWARVRRRCASDPGDLATAFAARGTLDLALTAPDGPATRQIQLRLRTLAPPLAMQVLLAQDVTERVRAERELREHLDLLDGIFRQLPVALTVIDKERRVARVSDAAAKMAGYSVEELVGRSTQCLYADAQMHADMGQQLYPPSDRKVLARARRKQGDLYDVEINMSALKDAAGETALYLGVIEDVTERLRVDAELKLFRDMVAHSSDALVLLDTDLRYRAVNPAYLRLWQRPAEQIIGRRVEEVVGTDLFESTIKDRLRNCLEGESESLSFIATIDRFPGGPRCLEATFAPFRNPEGVATGVLVNLRDVTDRVAAEAAVHSSERHLASLFRAAPIGIGVLKERVFQRVNPALCDLLGYRADELVGRSAHLLYVDDAEYERVGREKCAMLSACGLGEIETRFRCRDGRAVDVLLRSAWLDPACPEIGTTLTVLDITERKRQALALSDGERRARALLEAIPDQICRLDRQGVHLDFKPAHEHLVELDIDTPIGLSLRCLMPGDFADLIERTIAQTLDRRTPQQLVHGLEIPGRGWRDWEIRMVPSGSEEVIATIRDISERRQAEAALRESESRYRLLAEHSSDLISKHSLDGVFLYVSPSCRTLLGYEPEEMLGRSAYTFFHEDDLSEIRTSHETILSTSAVYRVEYRIRRKDGGFIWLETNSHIVEDSAEPEGRVIIAQSRDITESQQLRKAMVQGQKMEAIGRLTAGIAHDFNNILGSVLGFAELARQRNAGADIKLDGYLEQIGIAGQRARDLVRQLLVFSRGDSRVGAHPAPLVPMVKEVLKMLAETLPANLDIRFACPGAELVVEIDPLHIQQMLLNLMLNARDAMPAGGEIQVAARRGVVEGECAISHTWVNGDWVELSVMDRGCGIPDEHLDLIFQPFFSTKAVGEGSGMGLAVIAGLIRTYGGHVLVSSTLSEGSTFRLLLRPAEQERSPSAERRPAPE